MAMQSNCSAALLPTEPIQSYTDPREPTPPPPPTHGLTRAFGFPPEMSIQKATSALKDNQGHTRGEERRGDDSCDGGTLLQNWLAFWWGSVVCVAVQRVSIVRYLVALLLVGRPRQVTCQLDSNGDTIQNEKETLLSQHGASNHSSHCTENVDQR
jgi:hypothetical protein